MTGARRDQHPQHTDRGVRAGVPDAGAALRAAAGQRWRGGLSPGGEGIERDLLMLEDVTVSLITERRVSRAWGLASGEPGASGESWLLPGGDESRAERLLDKCTIRMRAGGWGTPQG